MSRRRTVVIALIICTITIVSLVLRKVMTEVPSLEVNALSTAIVFDRWEATLTFTGDLDAFRSLSNTQVNDAYDADRNGEFIRIDARFTHSTGHSMTVPAFAMKPSPGAPWQHTIRWSPDREGVWTGAIEFRGSTGKGVIQFNQPLTQPITARAVAGIPGNLVPPTAESNKRYLRVTTPSGSSKPTLVYGTCRAWALRQPVTGSVWGQDEMIDRKNELLAPMREHGMDLLSQWMAPWEYLLVHHGRAEHWEQADGTFKEIALEDTADWSSHQYYDQGRAHAFDRLVVQCEGDKTTPPIRLFLAPLPHPLFRNTSHPWSEGYGFWSPWENPELPPGNMNGFCTSEDMEAWDFFDADPRYPLMDERSKRFDHQANFFRYLIGRWGYSRAIGVWVILDEIEGIGDEEAYLPERTGFWEHRQCQRWLGDIIRLFNGRLKRVADNMVYTGDPYNRPTSAATSSVRGNYSRGANLDWSGGDVDARPDIQGWHWYPPLSPPISNWWSAWNMSLEGVMSFNEAPIGERPRIISEFGAEDRQQPQFAPSYLYPSIYHFSAWASALSGQAGTVMEWNDGKHFGEFFPKESRFFSEKAYPIFPAKSLNPLQQFMSRMDLDGLHPVNQVGGVLSCRLTENGIVAGMTTDTADKLYAWLFSPDTRYDTQLELRGMAPGSYKVTLYDTWTGTELGAASLNVASVDSLSVVNIQKWLYELEQGRGFPYSTRYYRGHDMAITILSTPPRQ